MPVNDELSQEMGSAIYALTKAQDLPAKAACFDTIHKLSFQVFKETKKTGQPCLDPDQADFAIDILSNEVKKPENFLPGPNTTNILTSLNVAVCQTFRKNQENPYILPVVKALYETGLETLKHGTAAIEPNLYLHADRLMSDYYNGAYDLSDDDKTELAVYLKTAPRPPEYKANLASPTFGSFIENFAPKADNTAPGLHNEL